MANAFDQFDAPKNGNPFDQFDAPKQKEGGLAGSVASVVNLLNPALMAASLLTSKEARQDAVNGAAGAVRGAGSIGASLLYPIDKGLDLYYGDRDPNVTGIVTGKQPTSRNQERRAAIDTALSDLGADTNSGMYGTGKLSTEVAGTLGVGPALGAGAGALGFSPSVVNAIATGGMKAGNALGVINMLTRIGGGAATGAATAGLIDPEQAGTGAVIGGLLPPVAWAAGKAGGYLSDKIESGANRLMQSAIKPTIKQLQTGDAATATQTLLDYGINPNAKGVNKLRDLIDGVDNQISNAIANSNATVDKQNVLNALADTRSKFASQVSPASDLSAIDAVGDGFINHPNFPSIQSSIPVQAAQDMKRGTYQVLTKKYGQLGSADTEAQKALARGLKDEIANAVPDVAGLNAEQSRLLTTLNVTERRALMEMNKNPMGLAALAHNPVSWAMFMADKSALFKSLAARMLNSASDVPASLGSIGNAANAPLIRSGAIRAGMLTNEGSP